MTNIFTLKKPILWGIFAVALIFGFLRYPNLEHFHFFELHVTFYWLLLSWIGWLVALYLARSRIQSWFLTHMPTKKHSWAIVGILLVAGMIYSRVHVAPAFDAFYDEPSYFVLAQRMYQTHQAVSCREGNYFAAKHLACEGEFFDDRPHLLPFFVSLCMQIFGDSLDAAFFLNSFLYLCTGVLIFFLSFRMFANLASSYLAMGIWLFWPLVIFRAGSAGMEILAAFCLALTSTIAVIRNDLSYKKKSGESDILLDVLLGLTAGLASQARAESPAIMFFAIFPVLVKSGNWAYCSGILSFIPYFMMDGFHIKSTQNKVTLTSAFKDFPATFTSNIAWLFDFQGAQKFTQPVFMTLCVLGTCWYLYTHYKKKDSLIGCTLIWPLSILFFSFMSFSSFQSNSVNKRYAVVFFPWAAIFAGGSYLFLSQLKFRYSKQLSISVIILTTMGILLNTHSLDIDTLATGQPPKAEFDFLKTRLKALHPKSLVFLPEGSMILALGYSTYGYHQLQAVEGATQPWWQYIQQQTVGNLYYLKGWECVTDPGDTRYVPYEKAWVKVCEEIEKKYELAEEGRQPTSLGYDIILYRIKGFKAQDQGSSRKKKTHLTTSTG